MSEAPSWFVEAVATPFKQRTVTVAGCPINVLQWGDPERPGLVLVHGGAAHAHWWSFIAPLLVNHNHVVALDLSGHGDSGRRDRYAIETWAREVVEVAADLGIRQPLLVGHSMGGFVSIVAAALYGAALTGAIFVDSPVREPDPERAEAQHGRAFRAPKTYPDIETALQHFHLIPPQPIMNDFAVAHVARHSLRRTEEGWTWKFDPKVFQGLSHRVLSEYLADIRCRVAVIYGEFSQLVTAEVSEHMARLLRRNAPFVEIPAAHHHLILDQPLAFIAALRALVAAWDHQPEGVRGAQA